MGQQNVERPQGLNASRPAPAADASLNKMPDWNPQPNAGQFAASKPLVTIPQIKGSSDDVMSFKSSSSNPMDAPLPHGRSYSEFPGSRANDSLPNDKVGAKVDDDVIKKGIPRNMHETGSSHV